MNQARQRENRPSAAPALVRGHVLAVDDDTVARRLLERMLTCCGYDTEVASSVDEALSRLAARPQGHFDCIVTDYQMPGLTGLDLLARVRIQDATLASIVVAGGGEKDLVAQTLRSGATNYLDKPYRREELDAAVAQAIAITHRQRELARAETDAAAVARVQRRLLGGRRFDMRRGVRFRHLPMRGAGGDFLLVFDLPDGDLLVLAGDVSGHDLQAAFISAYFQGIFRGMLEKRTPVAEVLSFFNTCLLEDWNGGGGSRFDIPTSLCVFAAVLRPAAGSGTVFCGGFPEAHFVDPSGNVMSCGIGGGNPMGWFSDSIPAATDLNLPPNGSLVVWTDGLEDHAENLGVSPWSLACALLLDETESSPRAHLGSATDDILVAFVPTGTATPEDGLPLLVDTYSGDQADGVDSLQAHWHRCISLGVPHAHGEWILEVLLCLREAVLNALRHGCQGRADRNATLQVHYHHRERLLKAIVEDPGSGHAFDWRKLDAVLGREFIAAHRGLSLMHHFARSVRSERSGARLVLELACPDPP